MHIKSHWSIVMVLNQNQLAEQASKPEYAILLMDSMYYPKRQLEILIKKFMQKWVQDRYCIEIDFQSVPVYRLLVPRQTNTRDCGIYCITYS